MWELFLSYPWGFLARVVLPALAVIGSIIVCLEGYESLQRDKLVEDDLSAIRASTAERDTTLKLLESYDEKVTATGRRDALLTALINQYQRLSDAAQTFARFQGRDAAEDRGKIAETVLDILNKDVVRTTVRTDVPGQPLQIEIAPNSYRVIFAVPMRIPPRLTFKGLPQGVVASVSDLSEISFTVTFLPLSVPVTSFGFEADAEL